MKRLKTLLAMMMMFAMVFTMPMGSIAAANDNTFYWATFSDPIDFNPCLAKDSASSDINQFLFSGLFTRDWNSKIIPDLAAAMPTISKDNKTLTIPLRKDVKWHDGKPFTSADVKFSIEFMLNKQTNSPRYANYELVDKVEAPNPYTVVIKMKSVDSAIIPTLANYYIIPKHIWEKVDPLKARESEYNKSKVIGNGPYKFVEWSKSERVVLQANADYYGKKAKINKLVFTITPNQAVAMVKTETGEANMVMVPESDIARMQKVSKVNVSIYDRAAFDCILYNIKSPFFSDKRVRQAISYAINKQYIVKGIYKGFGSPAEGSYHPKLGVYNPNVVKYNYDLAKAKSLLDQAGWKVGKDGIRVKDGKQFKFVLLTNKGNIMREKLLVEVQRQLKPLGISVEPRILEWNTFLSKYVDVGKFDAYVGGFSTGLDGDQTVFYHSDKSKASMNKGAYANPKVDELLDAARATMDLNKQKQLYGEVQKIVAEDQPMTFLVYRKNALAISKDVKNTKIVDILGFNTGFVDWEFTK